ncbi:MAG: DUF4294 domain-containing protein [Sphingobacteriales bacterium]|nr:DUF4294 domain-containing protein [Sphingobacteriales bacterium]
MGSFFKYQPLCIFLFVIFLFTKSTQGFAQQSANDTIPTQAIIYGGDTMTYTTMPTVFIYPEHNKKGRNNNYGASKKAEWTRLRNAIYVTFPYAKRTSYIINDINKHLAHVTDEHVRKVYLKSREKELRKEFTTPLTNLSYYQGRILMKLINRETGNNCYNIIKDYKGAFTARVYQTVAFFFEGNLKQPYDRAGDDLEIEQIVQEIERLYGYKS